MSRIIEEFRNLAWSAVKPKYLDYEYCQILLIGEHMESGVEPTQKDQKHDKETPREEIEKLEHEDELRVQHLSGKCTFDSGCLGTVLWLWFAMRHTHNASELR